MRTRRRTIRHEAVIDECDGRNKASMGLKASVWKAGILLIHAWLIRLDPQYKKIIAVLLI